MIANTCCNFCIDLDRIIPALVSARKILEDDYGVDMYSLPFYREDIKLKVERLDLINQLENYFKENNIDYENKQIFYKGQELSSNDSNIKDYIDKINKIDLDLINFENKRIDI